ncbi:MAG: hypothetical protein RL488_445 [Actinomycetota bacterium]
MVEPLFRFDGKPVAGSEITLDGPEGHHAASVRRMRAGEAIQLTNGVDTHARGVVVAVAPKSLTIRVDSVEAVTQPKLTFGLVQALAKGDRDELAIQAATELGATKITPWQAERSISRWDAAKTAKNIERWSTITSEAAKQALRPLFPVVGEPLTSKQLASSANANFLVLDPTAELSLADWQAPTEGHIELIVGPEGGISDHELELFESAGAVRVHLGSGILRTSTAGMAALAFLAGRSGLWR